MIEKRLTKWFVQKPLTSKKEKKNNAPISSYICLSCPLNGFNTYECKNRKNDKKFFKTKIWNPPPPPFICK